MSGGAAPPVVLPTPAPSVLTRIGTPAAPTVIYAPVPGVPGPAGPQGIQGAPGYAKRFGTIDYADRDAVVIGSDGTVTSGVPLSLPAGVWTRVVRNLSPSAANFNLPSGPFQGFTFWDNTTGTLRARALGDVLLFKFTFSLIPAQRDGGLRFSVRPGDDPAFEFGPEPIVLTADAGESQAGSETFVEQCRTRFVTSGASLYLMATSGATLLSFSPEVTPLDFAAS